MENTNLGQEQNTAPELTLTDLQNLRSIIDVASRRGAFGAAELSSVGTAFDKLDRFLTSVLPQATTETQQGE